MTPNALKIALDLPLEVREGHLDKLEMKIPWTNLGNSATVLVLSGLQIRAVVRDDIELSADDKHRNKQNILDNIEKQREAKALGNFSILEV